MGWRDTFVPARLSEPLPDGRVRCLLSPRHCTLKAGQHGFCGVRANRNGRLVSLNYGKSVHATEETIETEAVNHFAPGERILSMGNIGCMLNCAYCQNWKTSQAKHASDADIHYYTPEQVVDIALRHGIRVLSWTYNDPVVWHEFVHETAMLARRAGLLNLYKSAFYITPEAIDELLPHIDIFSISLKSMDPGYYRKVTTGHVQPVLDATRYVHRSGKHLELSTLMVTGLSDNEATARQVTAWVLSELDATVPMHFVRFHPDYRMRNTLRTPIPHLVRAREIALEMGAEHVYIGNVFDTPYGDTRCAGCEQLLVTRYGLNAQVQGLRPDGRCTRCGRDSHVKLLAPPHEAPRVVAPTERLRETSFDWRGDIRSLHVQVRNDTEAATSVYVRREVASDVRPPWRAIPLQPGESYRFIASKGSPDEVGCVLRTPAGVWSNLHEVFDRAHFPTIPVEQAGRAETDVSSLPLYRAC